MVSPKDCPPIPQNGFKDTRFVRLFRLPPLKPPPLPPPPPLTSPGDNATARETTQESSTPQDAPNSNKQEEALESVPLHELFTETDRLRLDRLSILACERQGIAPEELLYQPLQSFQARGTAAIVAKARWEAYERRRIAKANIVEQERSDIVATLSQSTTGRLSHAQAVLHTQLLQQPRDLPSNDNAEKKSVEQLLERESDATAQTRRLKQAIESNAQRGST